MPGSYIKADRSSFITSSGDKAELHKARYAKYINPMPGGSLRGRILVMDDEDFILDMKQFRYIKQPGKTVSLLIA
jgi:hypothetical protein